MRGSRPSASWQCAPRNSLVALVTRESQRTNVRDGFERVRAFFVSTGHEGVIQGDVKPANAALGST